MLTKNPYKSPFRLFAHYYYSMGFNVTCISNVENDYNFFNPAPLKAPNHKWEHLIETRQSVEEFTSYSWEAATGIGCVLGNSNLRCIDIDGITDEKVISEIVSALGLPPDYEWVFITGSGQGVHIYIESEQHKFVINNGQVKAFYPNVENKGKFKRLELRWKYHCVLPPSLHASHNYYEFNTNELPKAPPKRINTYWVYRMIDSFCEHSSKMSVEYSPEGSKVYFLNTKKTTFYNDSIDLSKSKERKFLIFDTETNGLPKTWNFEPDGSDNWPRLIQIGWYIFGENANFISKQQYLIKPEDFTIHQEVSELTGIQQKVSEQNGIPLKTALTFFIMALEKVDYVVAHNLEFDSNVLISEARRLDANSEEEFLKEKINDLNFDFGDIGICTMKSSVSFCNLPNKKFPKLHELYEKLFNKEIIIKHTALEDSKITALCFWELLWREIIVIEK